MKNLKPILALLLMFGVGVIVGVVGTRIVVRGFIRHAIEHPELVRERIERDLVRRLKLDSEQRAKVHEALTDTQKQLRDLRLEFQPQFVAIISDSQARIAAVLTPEQREKFEKYREENRRILPFSPLPPARRPGAP
jgi:hypothetical protein